MPIRTLKRLWTRLTNPSRAFVDDIFDSLPSGPPTVARQQADEASLLAKGYDVSQLPPVGYGVPGHPNEFRRRRTD
jgi:hypothetical protein